MSNSASLLTIDIPVALQQVRSVHSIRQLGGFEEDLPAVALPPAAHHRRYRELEWSNPKSSQCSTPTRVMSLYHDRAYDTARNICDGNCLQGPCLRPDERRREGRAVRRHGQGRNGWGNADLLPGVKINTRRYGSDNPARSAGLCEDYPNDFFDQDKTDAPNSPRAIRWALHL